MKKQHIRCSSLTIRPNADGSGLNLEIDNPEPSPIWDKEQVAELLKVTPRTVETYVKRKRSPLPHHMVGGLLRFDEQAVREWMRGSK